MARSGEPVCGLAAAFGQRVGGTGGSQTFVARLQTLVGKSQSVSAVQDVLHKLLVASQAHGVQLVTSGSQLFVAEQANLVIVAPTQAAAPHMVPTAGRAHWPDALQVPVFPHGIVGTAAHIGSAVPAATGAHIPSVPVIPHDRQVPHVASVQQNPSVQCPLAQVSLLVHAVPFGLGRTHDPDGQM